MLDKRWLIILISTKYFFLLNFCLLFSRDLNFLNIKKYIPNMKLDKDNLVKRKSVFQIAVPWWIYDFT